MVVAAERYQTALAEGMSSTFQHAKKLSTLDYAFDLLDGAHSPQDFAIILQLRKAPSFAALRRGADSATKRFAISGSRIKNRSWIHDTHLSVERMNGQSTQAFVNERFDLRRQNPVKQIVQAVGDQVSLVTRFHHAAADGLSAALWLGHQLSVAYGFAEPETAPHKFNELTFRVSANSTRRSSFAFRGASDPLWTTNYIPSGARHWFSIDFPATDLQRGCRKARGFTYSDLLATCVLETLANWNQKHDPKQTQKIGLWYPVNVRSNPGSGFGNGTSRIRLYARFAPGASLIDKAREVRKQVSWSTEHGEWVVPEWPLFTRLPRSIVGPLLNGYLRQPTVDMATAVFSHADRWSGNAAEAFENVTRIECIGLLHTRQHVAINGATHQGRTSLTFTYDPALLDADHARELGRIYEQQLALARKELTCERD
jgi:hypothetical protein